jgi:hypothetical protein
MPVALWSWVLSAVGIIGLTLAGSRRSTGWAIGLAAQALWIAYAVVTAQWGFIASAVAYGVTYGRNWIIWRRAERAAVATPGGEA